MEEQTKWKIVTILVSIVASIATAVIALKLGLFQ